MKTLIFFGLSLVSDRFCSFCKALSAAFVRRARGVGKARGRAAGMVGIPVPRRSAERVPAATSGDGAAVMAVPPAWRERLFALPARGRPARISSAAGRQPGHLEPLIDESKELYIIALLSIYTGISGCAS